MALIQIPKSFFVRERRDIYSQWELAFWRELFQNATDAGARAIDIAFQGADPDVLRIIFDDDGCGMTREILENVYFRLGTTTKSDSTTIGGFGRARILTCFSMHAYRIVTLDNLVEGDGASYEITRSKTIHRGCRLEIDVNTADASYSDMRDVLQSYLGRSQLKAAVTIDGEPFKDWLLAGRALRQICDTAGRPIGRLHLNHAAGRRASIDRGRLVVRVHGAYMFDRYVSGIGARMVLEIDPTRSREILTASRDSLMREPQSVFDALMVDLAVENASGIKPRRVNDTLVFHNSGFLTLAPLPAAETPDAAIRAAGAPSSVDDPVQEVRDWEVETAARGQKSEMPERAPMEPARAFSVAAAGGHAMTGGPGILQSSAVLPGLGDIHILSEEPAREVRRAMARFRPIAWDLEALSAGRRATGHTAYRLLGAWTTACELALRTLQEHQRTGPIKWTTGFYFGDPETQAVCRGDIHGAVLCLNPVDEAGRLAWRLASRRDLNRLLAYARHEAVHVVCDTHDQRFANLLTALDAAMDDSRALALLKKRFG